MEIDRYRFAIWKRFFRFRKRWQAIGKNIDPWRIIDTLYDRLYFSLFLHNTLALQREGLLQVIFTRDSFHNVRGFFLSFFLPFLSTRDNIDTRTKFEKYISGTKGDREMRSLPRSEDVHV